MKKIFSLQVSFALLLAAAPLASMADTITNSFTDDFAHGSTLTNATPASPTTNSTAYQLISYKNWNPAPSLTSGDLKFGIGATTGGSIEVKALIATNAVALTQVGDYLQLTVTFTNTLGLLTQASSLGFGLYNSGQVQPVAGGLNATASSTLTTAATGGAQNWQGYVGQVAFNSGSVASHRIMTRAAQTGTANNNQDMVTSGSGNSSYSNPGAATVGSTVASTVTLIAGATYTEVLTITLNDVNSLAITNTLYAGPDTSGTIVTHFGGVATNTTYLTSGFDSFAIGWRATANTTATTMDISSIQVTSHSTVVTGPPTITSQPVPVIVANGGSCAFSVAANGFNVTYQWHRNSTNLLNGGNISGATSSQLIVSPAGAADALSGANGYYVTVTGTGPFSTNSITNSLTLGTASNLIWSGNDSVWDLGASSDWLKGVTPAVFNYGDSVTFDDTGANNTTVTLTGSYLSAASVTVNSVYNYLFQGTGSFAGPGSLVYKGSGLLTMNNANSYSGGTTISNASAFLVLKNYNALGTGPVTLAMAGGNMEIVPTGSATLGINGNIIVADDFTITYDSTNGSYGCVLLGDLSGTTGKTLTINHTTGSLPSRIRVYGVNTVYNANLNLTDSRIVWALYPSSGSQTYNGVISGSGALIQRASGITILNGANTYSGGTTPTTGAMGFGIDTVGIVDSGPIGTGPLYLAPEVPNLTGSGSVFASGGARTIANPLQYPSGTNNLTLIIGGTNNLTLTGAFTLNGNDLITTNTFTARTVQVTNTGLTTLSGVISDGGSGYGFIKTGSGTLALNNTETYTGPTTVSNGTLQVIGQLNAASAVTVATNGFLGGTGTINGTVTVNASGTLASGTTSIGTLNLNNSLTLAGNVNVKVNRSGLSSDKAIVSGTLNNTGTGAITVTNLGAALQAGDTFILFNKAVANGAALTITGAQVTWTNKLAVDGSIAVLSTVATNPTNITFSVTSNVLTLSWPADHTGWRLQAQTNSLANGLGTNWVEVLGASAVNSTNFTINPANGAVFYRLVYP